jgi:hypothetical protein
VERIDRGEARLGIWRDAPSLAGARTAAIGGFACDDAPAGARLLAETAARLLEEGFAAVVGPMDGDTWSTHRLVVEAGDVAPFLLEPRNPAHYVDAFNAAGFEVVARYVSAEAPADAPPPRVRDIADATLRSFDPTEAEREMRAIHALSLQAFARNPFYRPISAERFLAYYAPLIPAIDPELAVLAEDAEGALVGFLFAIPDLEEGPAPRTAILKTCGAVRGGLGRRLVGEFHRRARDKGYARVVHALMNETNPSVRLSAAFGGRVFRRYALWGRRACP